MKPSLPVALVLASCTPVLGARDAVAAGPVDIEVAARGTYGTYLSGGATNPLSFGAGARAGASLYGFYAGADFAYYVGSGSALHSQWGFTQVSVTQRSMKIGGELGYGFKLAFLTVRPRVGVGDLILSSTSTIISVCEICGASGLVGRATTSSQDDLYIEGAVTVLLPIPQRYFVGLDAELLVIPNPIDGICCDELETAFMFGGQAGVRF